MGDFRIRCPKELDFKPWESHVLDAPAWAALSLNPVGAINHFQQYGSTDSLPQDPTWLLNPFRKERLLNKVVNLLQTQLVRDVHAPILEYEQKALSKWYAPQGATPSLAHLHESLKAYYPNIPYEQVGDFSLGILALKRALRMSGFRQHSLRFYPPTTAMELYREDAKASFSGLYLAGDRRGEELQNITLRHVLENPYVLEPPLAGHRWMRNKMRDIFMDEFGNLLRMKGMIDPVFTVLRDIPGFEMFKGKYAFDTQVSGDLKRPFLALEGDFDAMDTRVTYRNTMEIVVPILEFMYDSRDHELIKHFIYEMFHNPLVVSKDEIWTGTHSLFSGLLPTNLFESIMSWILLATMLQEIPLQKRGFSRSTLWDVARIFVLGDDNAVMLFLKEPHKWLNHKWDTRYGHMTLTESFAYYARLMGLKAQVVKQREAIGNFWFCREFHSKAARPFSHVTGLDVLPGVYPLILNLNSIVHPEFGSQTELSFELLRVFSIMDNVWGHPLAKPYWQLVASELRLPSEERVKLGELHFTEDELRIFNSRKLKDFKYTLAGFKFDLVTSPSYQWLAKGLDIVPAYRSNI